MSRLYFTAVMKHSSLGIDLPEFRIETADYSGGSYHIKGVHPTAIAALGGKLGELKKQERFDLKCNVNKQRAAMSLIINTKKHLPHVEWSSQSGMGPLPIGLSTLIPMLTGSKSSSKSKRPDDKQSKGSRSRSQRSSSSRRTRDSRYDGRHHDRYDDRHDERYDERDEDEDEDDDDDDDDRYNEKHDEKYDRHGGRRGDKKDSYDDRRDRHRSQSESRSRH